MKRLCIPTCALLLSLASLAGDLPDPVVQVNDDGSIVATAHLAVSPEVIRAEMRDPAWLEEASVDGH